MHNPRKRHIYLPVVFGVLTLSLAIFILEVFVGHISPIPSVIGILKRQFAKGENLFLIMVFGFIPFAILIIFIALLSHTINGKRLEFIFMGGLVGILIWVISLLPFLKDKSSETLSNK